MRWSFGDWLGGQTTGYALTSRRMRPVWGGNRCRIPQIGGARPDSRYRCIDATLRDRVNHLLAASARSDVPPFMVMDVMAAAARIEAAGGHVIHMEVGQPAAPAPKAAIAAAHAALDERADRLHLRARHSLAARADRATLPRYLWLCGRRRADRGHHGLVRRLHPGVPCDVRAGRPGRGHRARLSAVSPYPDRARLRAGADRDLERHPPRADRRSLACRASQGAAERRAGRQPRQSDRHDDVARGAREPDRQPPKAPASASSPTRSITVSIMRFPPSPRPSFRRRRS